MNSTEEHNGGALGIVIVSFESSEVIVPCLESLARTKELGLRIAIVDNASSDGTLETIANWVTRWNLKNDQLQQSYQCHESHNCLHFGNIVPWLTVIKSGANLGYAGACNIGLEFLRKKTNVPGYWILNPDCVVAEDSVRHYLSEIRRHPRFGLMGGRTIYCEEPQLIQSDGGKVSLWTGVCTNIHQGLLPTTTKYPNIDELQFISGANFIVSKEFYDQAGPMCEDYFLYYEEVDWAFRRGSLPLAFSTKALVYHIGGTAIGTGAVTRPASAFANYFNYRNRIKFLYRFNPIAIPIAVFYSSLQIVRLVIRGRFAAAWSAFRGLCQLSPPRSISKRLLETKATFQTGASKNAGG